MFDMEGGEAQKWRAAAPFAPHSDKGLRRK
jgi:hypothetical protein